MNANNENKDKGEGIKELIIARIDLMPKNYKLSIGDLGTFNKEEMIEHVKKGDKTGKQIIAMEINFIKALTTGKLIEAINQNE